MTYIRLTPENVFQYIGHSITFRTRNSYITKTILRTSPTGKTVRIDHPDLYNWVEIVNRIVLVEV